MSTRIISTFIIIFVFATVVIAEDPVELNYKPGEILIRFKKDKDKSKPISEKQKIIKEKGGKRIKKSFRRLPNLHLIELPENVKVKDALKKFKASKDILFAEPNYKVYLQSTFPDDPNLPKLWGLHNTGQAHPLEGGGTFSGTEDADIDAPEAWDISTDANDIIVAVLDTGIDYDHDDLAGNIWTNQAELTGDPNTDDDGNGYVDDIYGFDFADYDSDPIDYHFHGTHVAGTIGAKGDNGIGITGVCWNVKLMAIKIFPNYDETTFIDRVVEGIEYAIDNGAKVLNNSWGGGPYSQSLKVAIEDARGAGVLFIAAAGNYRGWGDVLDNDSRAHYPSSYTTSNIISVLATNSQDEMPMWSHYGEISVDLGAPGEDIYSTFPTYLTSAMDDYGFSTDYETIGGTSMATPHVAGACALLWSKYPYLSYLEVKEAILSTVDELDSLDGLCVTGGRLNLQRAMLKSFPLTIEISDGIDPNSCGVDPTDPNNNTITYTLTVSHEGSPDPNDPNSTFADIENVTLVDYLPLNIDPMNVTVSVPGSHDWINGTATWSLGTLSPQDSVSVTVTVTILEGVEPLGEIKNIAKVFALDTSISTTIFTPVCCYGGDIIYVDRKAQGRNVGLSWHDAYTELSSALNRAAQGCGSEVWVAGGIYTPTNSGSPLASLELADGVEVYGGFTGNETSRSQRNFVQNKTYLSGDISATDNDPNSFYVVSAGDGVTDSTILDGFVICRGVKAGVHLYDQAVMDDLYDPNTPDPNCVISPNIVNCYITNNEGDGIHGQLADPNIYACIIADNGGYGIIDANSLEVNINRCVIRNNSLAGINAHIADSGQITNCFIYQNGEGVLCYGESQSGAFDLRNNTIVYNAGAGISAAGGDDMPVLNCILWGNGSAYQMYDCEPDYCFIDSNSVSGTNYNTDPGFAYTEPNACNYHLAADSNCIDAGLATGIPATEKDIDGETRVYISQVDIGADEVGDCDDVVSSVDHNGDGIVNLIEFNLLARAWITYDPCSPPETEDPNYLDDIDYENFDERCDYENDSMIDILDLQEFAADWLWTACWREAASGSWLEVASTGSSSLQVPGTTSTAMAMSVSSFSMTVEPAPPEISPADQLLQAVQMLDFLNKIYNDELKGQIDKKTWDEFFEHLQDWVGSLADDYLKSVE